MSNPWRGEIAALSASPPRPIRDNTEGGAREREREAGVMERWVVLVVGGGAKKGGGSGGARGLEVAGEAEYI